MPSRIWGNVIAGVHFPFDSLAGRMLGVALGEYFVGRCNGVMTNQTFMNRKFLAAGADGNPTTDFNPFTTIAPTQNLGSGPFYYASPGPNVQQSTLLNYLWGVAKAEWAGRFP